MLRDIDPIRWNLIWMQMSHHEERMKFQLWRSRTKKIVDFMKNALK